MKEFVRKLFDAAKKAGATAAEAYWVEESSFEAMAMEGEITQYSANTTRGLGFRAMLENRMGYASTEAFDDLAVEQLVEGVVNSARYCEDTDEVFMHDGIDTVPNLCLYNPDLEKVSPEEKLDFVLRLEQEAKKYDARIERVGDSTVFSSRATLHIMNTLGLEREYTRNDCGAFLQPVAHEGESISTGVGIAVNRDFSALDPEKIATEAAQIAVGGLHAMSIPSGSYRVIFENIAMVDLLGVFSGVFSAENTQKGLSLLQGKIGEDIAASILSLVDDPLMETGLSSRPFDAEGVASKKHILIEKGKLCTFLHNLKTAHKDGVASTGNAGKAGYAGAVQIAPSNLYIVPGEKSLQEMMSAVGEGIVVTDVSGLHAGANAISGDFSLLSKGFFFQNGKKQKPVEQITVAGNFFEVLKSMRAIGDDLRFPKGGIGSPSVDVGELSVGGQ